MTKLTAANSPLLHVVKDEVNKPIYKAASIIANIDGEAAVVDYLMKYLNEASQPAARKRYTALIAGQSELLDTILAWYGKDLFRIAALEYAEDGETAAIDVVCGARCHSQNENERLRLILSKLCKTAETAEDTRPVQGPLDYVDLAYFRLVAQAESFGSPLEFRDFAELKTLEAIGFVEVIDSDYYPLVLVTEAGLAYLADYTIVPLYSAAPDNEFVIGPLSVFQQFDLRMYAANESAGTPSHNSRLHAAFLEERGLIEYVPRLVWLNNVGAMGGGYIVTEAGLAYLTDEKTANRPDPISDSARGRVVMAMECSYWRGLYGDPGPFEEMFDELCYWRKTRGMPPINAVPALDKLINDQIDFNPPLAAQLGLTRR
jgi:hypothetical protein